MRPASGRQTCDCFEEHGHQEFKKIVELEDAGVAIYRYIPHTQYEAQCATETEEVFIFRNSGDDIKTEEFTGQSGKKGVSCPRCRKMIERAKDLFKNLPPSKIREVTGVCNHCYQKHLKHCPCCDKIVDKFLKFCLETQQKSKEYREGQKSWVTQTELSFKRSVSNIRDGKERGTRLSDRSQEPQAPVSRYVPTIRPVQDTSLSEIYEKPRFKSKTELTHDQHLYKQAEKQLKVISFLDFPEEQNVVMEEKNEPLRKQKKNIADENLEQPLKSVSLIDSETSPRLDKNKQFTPMMKRDIKPEQNIYEESKFTPMLEKYIEPKLTMDKEVKPESIIETDTKPKSIMKKGREKARETGVPKYDTTPRGIKKRTDSSTTRHSFETIMKCLSEPNISVFSYTFPIDKIMPKKEMKRRVSSSELIKNTQDMLAEREEKAKKIKEEREEMKIKREEQKKQRIAEKKRLSEEQKRKQEEERVDIKSVELIDEELDEITAASKEGFAKRGKKMTEEEKRIKRKEKYNAFGEEKVGKAGLQGDQDKEREREEKRRDIEAHTALKEQVAKQSKEKSDEEKLRKQQEKEEALREKKAQEAEKSLQATQKQLKSEKITDGRKETIISTNDLLKKDDKQLKESLVKTKERDEKQHDVGAQTALKEQVAKQAKEKAEEEKLRKQQEKDAELIAKKAQDAEKALEATQKQLTSESKTKRKSLTEAKPIDKSDGDKGGNLDNTAKEEKVKGANTDDMAALLRDQLAKQKQQELEKERLRKEQEKEKELAEKRLKELEANKEAKKSAIKAPILKIEPEDSIDDNVTQVILKPDEVMDVIIGQKIYKVKSSKKIADKTAMADSTQAQKLIHSESLPKQLLQAFSVQKPEEPMLMQKKPTSGDKKTKAPESGDAKGVIRYTLSDRTFIDKGWTMLPTEKVVRKVIKSRRGTNSLHLTETMRYCYLLDYSYTCGCVLINRESNSSLGWAHEVPSIRKTVFIGGKRMNVYRMRPAKPEFDWFEHNKHKREMTYDSGEKLAEFDDNGRGRWYYRTGELALDYYDAEETNAGQRFVVYSTGLPDERGRSRPRTLLATFDYSGNGIVFDHTGKIRLKYNQTEGVVLDRAIGPVSHWKWHTLNDPPVLQQVMIDTQMPYKDPTILRMGATHADAKRPDNEEMLAIEFENFLKEKRQKLTQSFKPFQIKMKAMKINEYFSLRVLDQASIYLLFRDGTTNLKLNIGMILDHKEIVDTDTAEICEVSNTLDKLPACTDSIAGLQKAVAKAQAQERLRVRHEHRLKPPQATASVDALRAGCSRRLRSPVVQASVSSCDKMTPKRFKPSTCNLYYNTQLF